jgi:hypothetical protein
MLICKFSRNDSPLIANHYKSWKSANPLTHFKKRRKNTDIYNKPVCMNLSIQFVRTESKISGLAEVDSASFFLSLQFTNPLISPTESGR